MSSSTSIGVVGLGVMGGHMARNLLAAGDSVTVHTRTRERAEALLQAGASWATSPSEVAASSDIVITALPDEEAVRSVVTDADGLVQGATDGLIWIDVSTISPAAAQELAQEAEKAGIKSLDAPVSGGEEGAREGTLAIMVGGAREVYESCLPVLQCLGTTVAYMGESGAGQVTKACNQMLVGITIGAVSEALALGARAGIDPVRIRDVLLGGFAASRVLEAHGRRMLAGDFQPGGRLALHRKDLDIALGVAHHIQAAAPLSALVLQLMQSAAAAGDDSLDHSVLVRVYERLNGKRLGE